MTMKTFIAVLTLLVLVSFEANAFEDEVKNSCFDMAFSVKGYPGGMVQDFCEKEYPELPSPFTFKCISWIDRGFPNAVDWLACVNHFDTAGWEGLAPKA